MEISRFELGFREVYFSLLTVFAAVAFTIAGVQWGFLIPLGLLFAILLTAVIILNIKIGLILLLCSYFYVRPIYYLPFSILTYIRLDDVVWGLVMISWLVSMRKRKMGTLRSLPLLGALTALSVIALLSGVRVLMLSPALISIGNFVWFLLRLLQYVSVYFVVSTADFTTKERSSLFTLIIVAGLGIAGVVFLQFLGILKVFPLPRYIENAGAFTATFSFKTQIGAVAMILTLLVLDKIVRHKWNGWLGFLLLACFSLLLMITQSRSAWVAFLVGIMVYLLSMRNIQAKIIWATILLAAGMLFFGMQANRQLYNARPIIDPVTGKLSRDEAVSARLRSLPLIYQYLRDKPEVVFLGVGFMNWRYTLSASTGIYGGHNNYLTALLELGLFGLAAFGYLLWRGGWFAWNNIKRNRPFAQFYLAVLIGLCAASFFEDIFWPAVAQESFLAFFMFISALCLPPVLNHHRQPDPLQEASHEMGSPCMPTS